MNRACRRLVWSTGWKCKWADGSSNEAKQTTYCIHGRRVVGRAATAKLLLFELVRLMDRFEEALYSDHSRLSRAGAPQPRGRLSDKLPTAAASLLSQPDGNQPASGFTKTDKAFAEVKE